MIKKLLLLAFSGLLLSGCSSPFEKPSSPELTGKYDGLWRVATTYKKVNQGAQVTFTCSSSSNESLIFVDRGQVYLMGRNQANGVIDAAGVMYAKFPDSRGYRNEYNQTVRGVIHLSGHLNLSSGSGSMVKGFQGASNGCTYSVDFSRFDNTDFMPANGFKTYPFSLQNMSGAVSEFKLVSRSFSEDKSDVFKLESDDKDSGCYGLWVKTDTINAEVLSRFTKAMSAYGVWAANCLGGVSYRGEWGWSDVSDKGHAIGIDNNGQKVTAEF